MWLAVWTRPFVMIWYQQHSEQLVWFCSTETLPPWIPHSHSTLDTAKISVSLWLMNYNSMQLKQVSGSKFIWLEWKQTLEAEAIIRMRLGPVQSYHLVSRYIQIMWRPSWDRLQLTQYQNRNQNQYEKKYPPLSGLCLSVYIWFYL